MSGRSPRSAGGVRGGFKRIEYNALNVVMGHEMGPGGAGENLGTPPRRLPTPQTQQHQRVPEAAGAAPPSWGGFLVTVGAGTGGGGGPQSGLTAAALEGCGGGRGAAVGGTPPHFAEEEIVGLHDTLPTPRLRDPPDYKIVMNPFGTPPTHPSLLRTF